MALRLIGYWKASLLDEYPLPQEVETDFAPDLREQIAS
jgi:hypothetical protein